MIRKNARRYIGTSLIAGAVMSAMAPAAAQQLEEIVVTARRRAESFQDVPVTITAFDQQTIDSAGIQRPQDFIALTPNVTLVETQNQGTSFITVRGISQARNSEPSVAVLVDGVLMTNPAQFTQELFDVQQIEVLKGAQGAVYGRNAIGGAMVITTREPGNTFEGRARLGYDSGPGMRAQLMGSGPLGDSDTLKFHAAISHFDTDGYIPNAYLNEEADPFKDTSLRARLLWEPTDRFRADARLYWSELSTQALYFNIVEDANDTSLPVRVNNPGMNDRDLSQISLKFDYELPGGTLTAITSYDTIEEILTGDQFDFLPIEESVFFLFGIPGTPFNDDLAQSQFLDVKTLSQEIRFTSDADDRLRWIAGAYMVTTDRFISTGNIIDRGLGAFPVYRTPRGSFPGDASSFPNSFQLSFLADEQDNFAWALFGEVAYDVTDRTEISVAARYDKDTREQTTLTPNAFLAPFGLTGSQGQVRKNSWDELQPRLTVRHLISDTLTVYGGYSKGFRSGGFNQTGVAEEAAAEGMLGVGDEFGAEVAETLEAGLKTQLANGRVNLNLSVFDTRAEGGYFFVFLPGSSTQNLGTLRKVDYRGYELDVTARVTDYLDLFLGYGATDSKIKQAEDPTQVGNEAPLVSEDTLNAGVQFRHPLGRSGLDLFFRTDYQRIGDTYWEPFNLTVRNPVNLLDLRLGIYGETWSLVGWQRNFNDVEYNAEFSPGGFVFKGKPRRWGIDFTKEF